MSSNSGFYSVIQFSARPSSFEYINVGVVVASADGRLIRVRVSNSAHRVKRLFEEQSERDFQFMASSFAKRIQAEFSANPSLEHLSKFAESRANLFRLLPFRGMLIDDIDVDVQNLYFELVGEDRPVRRHSAQGKLAEQFRRRGVLDLIDRNPQAVIVPGARQAIRADYGYQNGHYNLIEAVSFKPKQELNALRRISGDALLLKKHSDKRLVVVADLPDHSQDLLQVIEESVRDYNGKVYDLNAVAPLVDDIRRQGIIHNPSRLIQ